MSLSELPQVVRVESLADQAYHAIREGIVVGTFAPGQRVTERGLSAQLNVSPTPIREAMRRLEQERLLERNGRREVRVVHHSAETLKELLEVEVALRSMEARFATRKITDETLAEMEHIVDAFAEEGAADDPEHLLDLARQFDRHIENAADNPVLRGLIVNLAVFGRERRARAIGTIRSDPAVAQQRVQDHRDMLAAFRARDPDLVERTFRDHAMAAAKLLLGKIDDAASP